MTSLREAVLAKLADARAVLAERQGEVELTAKEWQKGYMTALEEILDLEGLSWRRHPRRPTNTPTEIARILPETGAPGQRGKGTIVDLSVGGCGLATAMELSRGDAVTLSFFLFGLPDGLPESTRPIPLDGAVRHAKRVDGEFRAGVEFQSAPRLLRTEDAPS